MLELASWFKKADANSFGEGLTATEAKALKDYLHPDSSCHEVH